MGPCAKSHFTVEEDGYKDMNQSIFWSSSYENNSCNQKKAQNYRVYNEEKTRNNVKGIN
jgi:hypothetical protein